MKGKMVWMALAVALVGGWSASAVRAEDAAAAAKTLPTLLIKGEVVSLDSSDATAPLLKVKDRYGFETPIYLMAGTKIAQGETALDTSALAAGATVEVEYNFDVNTAKRHAVSVKLPMPPPVVPPEALTTPPQLPATTPAQPSEAPASAPSQSGEEQAPAGETAPSTEQAPVAQ